MKRETRNAERETERGTEVGTRNADYRMGITRNEPFVVSPSDPAKRGSEERPRRLVLSRHEPRAF